MITNAVTADRTRPAPEDDDGGIVAEVIACQGPPCCDLQDDEAVEAQAAGCPWCDHIYIHADGTETREGPVRA